MIQELRYADKDVQARDTEVLGGYNDAFPNMKELTEEEFAKSSFWSRCIEYVGYRQILPDRLPPTIKDTRTLCVRYFITDRQDFAGYAMSQEYWESKVRYFRFGPCEHKYRNPTEEDFKNGVPRPAMCFNVHVCEKCGYVYAVDSSD